jgi:hypothetical protein
MNSLILSGAVAKAIETVKGWFTPSYLNDVESYLSESVDLFDLERRIKLLQNRGFV